jgi:crotonobetainyl-CoA:carnitine CoA-transferase CaiB-like acyl-CoA transferase
MAAAFPGGRAMVGSDEGLRGLTVVDLGLGMAAALAAKFLREAGAEITRIEPAQGDPFYDAYPAYPVWRRGIRIEREASPASGRIDDLLARADICIVGGEDYPGVERRNSAPELQLRHPNLIVLDIGGYPSGTAHAGRPATDALVQARSGLSYEHYSQRPLLMSFEPSSYGAALHGLCGLFAALLHRESTGKGQVVSTSLYEGALAWSLQLWCEMDKPTPATQFVMPKDPWPLIFRCADGVYVQVVLGSAGSKGRLYQILRINDPTVDINDSGMPKPTADAKNFFGDIDVLAKHVETWQSRALLEAIWAAGLPAEPVLAPGGCWDDAQVKHNGIVVRDADGTRSIGHPLTARASPAPRRATLAGGRTPLAGIKVIDFGAFVAGPYTSTVLADFGADVIKVEPLTGDPNRSIFRSWTSSNRGKRCLTIDLKTPEGLKIARQLCVAADVVTSNFRPGVSARLGIDAKALHGLKPELIVLESAAYGTTGPRADGSGFDMCFQALCGHDWRGGGTGNPPLWNRTSMVDFTGGLLGAVGVLQHLYQRARSGAGTELGAGLLNAGLFLLSELVQRPGGQFEGAPPLNARQTGYHPAEQLYQATDGWLAIAARGDAMAQRLLDVLDLGSVITASRREWSAEAENRIAEAVGRRGVAELCAALQGAGVWAEPCCPDGERQNLEDADLAKLGIVYDSHHPQFGVVKQIGPLVRLSSAAPAARRHAPLPGEHTDAILAELGYSAADIAGLRERKIVK